MGWSSIPSMRPAMTALLAILAAIAVIVPLWMVLVIWCFAPKHGGGRPMTTDDELGMAWWNGLRPEGRAHWAALARTGRAKDAWVAARRRNEQEIEAWELSRASQKR
jgi:hypothetical protein